MKIKALIVFASAVLAIAWGIAIRHEVAFGGEMVIPMVAGAFFWWEVMHEYDR